MSNNGSEYSTVLLGQRENWAQQENKFTKSSFAYLTSDGGKISYSSPEEVEGVFTATTGRRMKKPLTGPDHQSEQWCKRFANVSWNANPSLGFKGKPISV